MDIDDKPLRFGKYRGASPNEVADLDPDYLVWAYDVMNPKICSKELSLECEERAEGPELDDPYGA